MTTVVERDRQNVRADSANRRSRLNGHLDWPIKRQHSDVWNEPDSATITELSRLLMEGEELLGMYAFELAIERFSECLAKVPHLATAAEGLAEAYDRLGQRERASEFDRLAATIRAALYKRHPREPVSV